MSERFARGGFVPSPPRFAGPPEVNRRAGDMLRIFPGGEFDATLTGQASWGSNVVQVPIGGTVDRLVWFGDNPTAVVLTDGRVVPWHALMTYRCERPEVEPEDPETWVEGEVPDLDGPLPDGTVGT